MALATVQGKLLDGSGKPQERVRVTATLVSIPYSADGASEVIAPVTTQADNTGYFSMALLPATDLEGGVAIYKVTYSRIIRYISVPVGGVHRFHDLLTPAPRGEVIVTPGGAGANGRGIASVTTPAMNTVLVTYDDGTTEGPFVFGTGPPGPGAAYLNTLAALTRTELLAKQSLAGIPQVPPGTLSLTADTVLTKPLSMAQGAFLAPAAGVTLTLAGILAAPGQQVFTDNYPGRLKFKAGKFGELPLSMFLDESRYGDPTYDAGPGLRNAIEAAAEIVATPPSGVLGPDYLGGMIRLPRGGIRVAGPIEFYSGTFPRGYGEIASSVIALDSTFVMHAYDPRPAKGQSAWADFSVDGANKAEIGVLYERGSHGALRNMTIHNCRVNFENRGSQQMLLDNVDLTSQFKFTEIGCLIDRSVRNFKAIMGTWKGATKFGLQVTQSTVGATDSGSADSVIRPSRITIDGTVLENNGLHAALIEAGTEIVFMNGQSSGSGNGIPGDANEFRSQIRIAARLEPVAAGQPASNTLNRIEVAFINWGLNGGAAQYAIDARAEVAASTLTAGGAVVAGATVTATSRPKAVVSVQGRTAWTAATSLVLADDRAEINIDEHVKPVTANKPLLTLAPGANRAKSDILRYRGGLVTLAYTGVVGETFQDRLPVPQGAWEVISHVVSTADQPASAVVVDMKRQAGTGALSSIWAVADRATVSTTKTDGTAGDPTIATLDGGDRLSQTATGTNGQRYTGVLTLRNFPV